MSLSEVRQQLFDAAERSGRDPAEVTIVAIGKSQPVSAILAAYEEGHRDFGENRAQELISKVPNLPSDIRWHFVGSLQTNKVRLVRPVVKLLHSMDRVSLAEAWVKGPGLPPPVLLQVNIGAEPQKAGVAPERARELLERVLDLGIDVRGLMAIPPMGSQEEARKHFRLLKELRESLASVSSRLEVLSMGMSDDFVVAVEEGSTMVRVGRAIFGPRRADG